MKDTKDILYIGLEVNVNDKLNLISKFASYIPSENWKPKFVCTHMTLAFHTNMSNEIINFSEINDGKTFEYNINRIGISDKAVAFGVLSDVPSMNSNKHITLAINQLTNGKPFDSNLIDNWINIDSIKLFGTLKIHYK